MVSSRLFELRTYHAEPGRLDALLARFRDHTMALFAKHGLTVIGFWTALGAEDQPLDKLVYMLAFDDRAAAEQAWSTFRVDPAWVEAKTESEKQGPLVARIESTFLTAADFSPLS